MVDMEKGKRILFLISRFLDGGIDTVLVEYLNNLQLLTNHQLTLCIMLNMGDGLEVYLPRLSKQIEVVYLIPQLLTWYKRQAIKGKRNAVWSTVDELFLNPIRRQLVRSRLNQMAPRYDAVVDFDSCWGAFIKEGWPVRKIAFFHFSFRKELERVPRRIRRFEKKIARYDWVVTISDAMLQEGQDLFPAMAHKFVRIYNSLNLQQLEVKAGEAILANVVKTPYLLAVERLEEGQKDIATLLDAYAILNGFMGEHTPYMYIIGKGKDAKRLEQKARSLHLGDKTPRFLGFQSNPLPWMKNAVAIVHSAKFEGLPTVLIEALLLNKLIVSTDCPTGPREILNEGKAGLLVPVGNAEAFANAIKKILVDVELQHQILDGVNQHKRVFMPQDGIKKFESLL